MGKNGMVKRLLVVLLLVIAVIGLNMQGTSVFAETLQPEGQSETTESQPESLEETSEEDESVEQTETEESEPPEGESDEQTETVKELSVSGNDISEEAAEDQDGTVAILDDEDTEPDDKLTDEILKECIVKGMNPPGVTVNLFDYWQGTAPDGSSEVAHDYYYKWSLDNGNKPDTENDKYVNTYKLGISENHLLRFGYRGNEVYDYCRTSINGKELGDYGVWNEYNKTKQFQGIVKSKLSPDGFPILNFSDKPDDKFGRYADAENCSAYLTENNKTESLAYLFSPNVQNQYKESYSAVQGLFRQRSDGYYYYDSRINFASFNNMTNTFTLYNSPGVAKENNSNAEFCGQFFPFNTAYDVFDSYIENDDGSYELTYKDIENQGKKNSDYTPVMDGESGYIRCYAPNLNHYLGLTLEMRFVQPVGGCVTDSTDKSVPMIFRFSGDDDVWIFIDDVLVADLGGIHDALELSINFATGVVNVEGSSPYTLYDAFLTAYGENSNLGGVEFNGKTFADNTTHTLKMFYLERGHMASNLSLSFNIQPLPSPPGNNEGEEVKEDKNENSHENEEDTSDSDTSVSTIVEIPVSDNTLYDNTEIPKTGDDSLIGWWAALCILSLIGISATVCNLIIRKRKRNK